MKKTLSLVIVTTLLISAPGLLPYEAAAQAIRSRSVGHGVSFPGKASAGIYSVGIIQIRPFSSLQPMTPVSAHPTPVRIHSTPSAIRQPTHFSPLTPVGSVPQTPAWAGARNLGAKLQAEGSQDLSGQNLHRFWDSASDKSGSDPATPVPSGTESSDSSFVRPTQPQEVTTPPSGPQTPTVPPGEWGSSSPDVGIRYTSAKYLMMRSVSGFFDFVNRYVQWYQLPRMLGVANLAGVMFRMRLTNLFNNNAYSSKPKTEKSDARENQIEGQDPSGRHHDLDEPDMGAAGTRFARLSTPVPHGSDVSSRIKERTVRVSEDLDRRRKFKPAGILNIHAGGWIQFNVHDWMNHLRASILKNPIKVSLPPGHPLEQEEMILDRTAEDPTQPTDSRNPPTYLDTETHWWDLSEIYGSSPEKLKELRTFKDGKMIVNDDGRLPEDPQQPGVDLTGFSQNYSVLLSFLHTLFVKEHNSIAEAYKVEHPDWNDEKLFRMARMVNVALIAKIHTVEWTRALLPNDTLQNAMWVDWYGMIGKRLKLWLMRRVYPRHPRIAKRLNFIRDSDLLSGMPGSPTDQFTAPYAMPQEFVEVYRLHPLLDDLYEITSLATGKLLETLRLKDIQGRYTRGITQKYAWEDLLYSLGIASAGALELENFPEDLRHIETMDGRKLDMSVVDMLRVRERSPELTFNEFRRRIGMRPAKSFLELTGGDKELAKRISDHYNGDIEQVDLQIGLRAVKKPKAFAISDEAFRIFVLMAPRRLKSDRFLSEMYTPEVYTQMGIDWIEHNTMSSVVMRHYSQTRAALEGLDNFFKPWPKSRTLHERLYDTSLKASSKLLTFSLVNAGVSFVVAVSTFLLGFLDPWSALALGLAPGITALVTVFMRMSSLGEFEHVTKYAKTDIRGNLFKPLFHAESIGLKSARWSILGTLASMDIGGIIAIHFWATLPLLSFLLGGTAVLTGFLAWRRARKFKHSLNLLRVGLTSVLKEGQLQRSYESLPGKTALEKHGRFFSGGKEVETFRSSFHYLRSTGLLFFTCLLTAVLSHILFSRKTQRNMTREEKARFRPGRFDIYVPNLSDAQNPSNTGVYAKKSLPDGTQRGDINTQEFDRIFRQFAVGRDYITQYDLTRMLEANMDRETGSWFKRMFGRIASKRQFDQLFKVLADRVVWEEEKFGGLVPAISRDQLLRFYQGGALYDIAQQRTGKK
ncbi:MAG: hypothetical protein HY399_09005 [Elusimicrobia bacterium]|nr:hypothetical protein [Elusimicrobiota bacterium]